MVLLKAGATSFLLFFFVHTPALAEDSFPLEFTAQGVREAIQKSK